MVSVVLAGGGTAGHTSPLIATAEQLRVLDPEVRLTAVGTPRGLETRVIPEAGLPLELISPVPLPRRPGAELVKVPFRLRGAVNEARAILTATRADVVVGFGGYVSMPVYLAARRSRVPIVIHEQNAVPGIANKVAARLTGHVATSFPETPLPKAHFIGLPLRVGITGLDRAAARADARRAFDLDPNLPVLLVSGGSQGARSVNTACSAAVTDLLGAGVQVLHVLGPKNFTDQHAPITDERSGARYRPVAYVDRMADAYAAADLMLCRSGAGTVVETAVVGLPSIFVPLPHGNGEQARNADALVAADAALLVADGDLDAGWLRSTVPGLINDRDRLHRMGSTARGLVPGDAAEVLADWVLRVARGQGRD